MVKMIRFLENIAPSLSKNAESRNWCGFHDYHNVNYGAIVAKKSGFSLGKCVIFPLRIVYNCVGIWANFNHNFALTISELFVNSRSVRNSVFNTLFSVRHNFASSTERLEPQGIVALSFYHHFKSIVKNFLIPKP